MIKFYTVCYGDTELVDGRRHLTSLARKEIKTSADVLKKELDKEALVLIVSSSTTPALESVSILKGILEATSIQDKVLSLPSNMTGKVIDFMEKVVKDNKKYNVFIVITHPDNHDCLQTRLQRGLGKKAKSTDLVDLPVDSGDDFSDEETLEIEGHSDEEDVAELDEEEML